MKSLFPILILVVLFSVCALAVFYLARRTAFVFSTTPVRFYWGYALLLLTALSIMSLTMSQHNTHEWAHLVTMAGVTLVGILLYFLLSTLLVDLVHLFAHFSPHTFGILAISITILSSGYALWNAATPRVKEVSVVLPHLTKPMNIVQLSDLHLGNFRGQKHLQKLVDKVNETSAEAVVITGDFFDSQYNCTPATLEPLKQIRVPIYFVDGNHDLYIDDHKIKQMLRAIGVHVLENEKSMFGDLQIVGLNYMIPDDKSQDYMHAAVNSETMEKTLPKMQIDSTLPSILLHHNPTGAEYAEKNDIGLYLAGHTHGGQLFPLTIINHFVFKYNRGLHRLNQTQIYVSVGSGTFGPPMRLGTQSEITLLHLLPQK